MSYVMLCDITCHVMLYNICYRTHVMSCYLTYVMSCYITYVMSCYITYVIEHTSCHVI